MSASTPPGAVRGFTLIEVQLALLMLALILMLAFSALYLMGRSWQASEQLAERNDELRTAGRLLRRHIGQAVPLLWYQGQEAPRLIFKGERTRLRLVSPLPAYRGGGGLQLLFLQVRAGEQPGEASYLGLGYLPVRPEHSPFQSSLEEREIAWLKLVEGAEQIEFSYYGEEDEPGLADWHPEWRQQGKLPRLVRLRLHIQNAKPWPELVLPVRAGTLDNQVQRNVYAKVQR